MKFTFRKDEQIIDGEFPTNAHGHKYAELHGYEIVYEESESEPTEEDDVNAMLVDHEYRLTLLELGITEEV